MTENKPKSSSRQADFQDIFDQAIEEKAHHAQMVADSVIPGSSVTRKHVVAGSLAVAIPLLATLLAVNVFGISLVDLMTPAPSPDVARRQAQAALDDVVKGIEGYRQDYAELPERLVEVAAPSRGEWTYTRTPNGHYRVVVEMYGHSVSYDSAHSKPVQ
jgi:hypothetical protein